MTCYYPIQCRIVDNGEGNKKNIIFQNSSKSVTRDENGNIKIKDPYPDQIPCGNCIGCRLKKAKQWAIRCMHEKQYHENSSFITLTYSDEKINENKSLDKKKVQKFMKKLRKAIEPEKIRFYMCGEYAPNSIEEELKEQQLPLEKRRCKGRPHYHIIIFGYDFPDKTKWKTDPSTGITQYRSKLLESKWTEGYSTIGNVTPESILYTAKYILKKINGKPSKNYYQGKEKEYTTMSRRDGIGKKYLDEFKEEIYKHDSVIFQNIEIKPPSYYDKLYDITNPKDLYLIKKNREEEAKKNSKEITPERLETRRTIAEAKNNINYRNLNKKE